MNSTVKKILDKVSSWPEEDQQELAEIAREIEARRSGVYVLNDDERAAIAAARKGAFASDQEMAAFWKRHGIA
jgi:ParB-like chromosome segregation protein Spo0J